MKLVLDENLPHQLRHELPGHDCFTVSYMGWAGLENGKLLATAAGQGFGALLTKDANLQYEQNLMTLPVSVVILHALSNDINDIRPLIPELLLTLSTLLPQSLGPCAAALSFGKKHLRDLAFLPTIALR